MSTPEIHKYSIPNNTGLDFIYLKQTCTQPMSKTEICTGMRLQTAQVLV